MFSILANSKNEEYEKNKYIKIHHIGWDSNLYLNDNTFLSQRLRPLSHADSQRNNSNYDVIILNMLKEKTLKGILAVVNC